MQMDRKTLLLVTLFVEGGLYLLGLLLMGGPDALHTNFSLTWSATAYSLLLCLPMFVSLIFVTRSRWELLVRFRKELDEKVLPIFLNSNIVDLAIISLLAGVGEELFFRGWMQTVLAERSGVWVGILAASLIFGLLHYLSITYAIYALATGIYLGVIYYVFGNLYIVMAIHAVYDFVALVYLVRKGRQITVTE